MRKPSNDSQPKRVLVIRTAKWLIGWLVVAGLGWTLDSACIHWQQQTQRIEAEIGLLDQELRQTPDTPLGSVSRQRLIVQRESLERQLPRWDRLDFRLLTLAGILYAVGLLPAAVVLQINCRLLETTPRWSTVVAAQLLGHIGKYIPGKAMVVLLRVVILRRDHVGSVPATISIFAETLTMMAAGATLAGGITVLLGAPAWLNGLAILLAVTAMLPTLPPVMRIIVGRLSKVAAQSSQELSKFNLTWLAKIWLISLVSWCFIGGSFALVIAAVPGAKTLPEPGMLYSLATASMGLAMVAGFASLLPGGAGVRELVLATVLGVAIDPSRGFLAAIAARVLSMIVETMLATGSWIWLRIFDPAAARISFTGDAADERDHSP